MIHGQICLAETVGIKSFKDMIAVLSFELYNSHTPLQVNLTPNMLKWYSHLSFVAHL